MTRQASAMGAGRTGHSVRPLFRWAPLGLAAALLVGCGGSDDDNNGTPPPTAGAFSIGGAVTGLGAGKTVTLQNTGKDDLTINANGNFVFVTRLDSGIAYAVTVKTQPSGQRCTVTQRTQPSGQSCTVRNGTGSVVSANVGSVEVSCGTVVALPEGDWKQELCVVVRPGTWGRSLWRITRQGDNRVAGQIGVTTYADANCTGAGTVAGPLTGVGNVAFDRNGSTATLTAFWGLWTQPSGLTSRAVWARKGSRLCIFGDQIPTAFPTAVSVESYVDTVLPNKTCYTQN